MKIEKIEERDGKVKIGEMQQMLNMARMRLSKSQIGRIWREFKPLKV